MKFSRSVLVACTFLALSVNSSVIKIADALFEHSNLKSKLVSSGITGEGLTRMVNVVDISVNSLIRPGEQANFIQIVKGLPVASEDLGKKNRLLKTLSSPMDKVGSDEFIESLNDLIFIANRYNISGSQTLSCSVCVSDELARIGIRNTLSFVSDRKVAKILERIPQEPRKLSVYLKRRITKLGIKDVTQFLSKEDERAFALFLELKSSGDEVFSSFVDAVISFNRSSKNSVSLAGPESIGQLWRVINSDLSADKMKSLTKVLNEASKERPEKRVDAFFEALTKSADGDSEKISNIEELRTKNCFFN
ncbi:hypothetical protein [Bacteriovorax sp. Seq25_V]|uniref:hypothetical protein n=1 Tax=Bacteriovorax sp. Seq25_V TaxID=1201288 RepID=UPI000389F8D0|nr:hypothetical protein [Bacteriovorax sp. Seq25_V]EQC44293.1 hypothetical protein M900_A0419 [Bacteriovorax sp. Seq25_V]